MHIERLAYQGPIRALQILPSTHSLASGKDNDSHISHPRILLCGTGPFLLAFDLSSGAVLARLQCRPDSVVHGIRVFPSHSSNVGLNGSIIAFGGKYLTMIDYSTSDSQFQFHSAQQIGPFPDWILDVMLLEGTNGSSVSAAVAYSHNFVEFYRIPQSAAERELEQRQQIADQSSLADAHWTFDCRVRCSIPCTLWSAQFHLSSDGQLKLACGTVFNEILIWSPAASIADNNTVFPVLQRLIGHEGMVFNVRFSADGRYLISASDDRFIRLWSLFDSDSDNAIDQPTSTVYRGLGGRAWDAVMDDRLVAAVGEDSTIRVWDRQSGRRVANLEGHSGKSVRHLALYCGPGRETLLASGGDDGSVRLWPLQATHHSPIPIAIQFPESTDTAPFIRDFDSNGHKTVAGLSDGRVYIADVNGENSSEPTQIAGTVVHYDPISLLNFCCCRLSFCNRWLFIADRDGWLTIIDLCNRASNYRFYLGGERNQLILLQAESINSQPFSSSSLSFHVLCSRPSSSNPTLFDSFLYKFSPANGGGESFDFACVGQLDLTGCDQLFPNLPLSVLSAILIECRAFNSHLLVVGTSGGHLVWYRITANTGTINSAEHPMIPISGRLECPHDTNNSISLSIFTTARDGYWARFEFLLTANSAECNLLLKHRPPPSNSYFDMLMLINGQVHGLAFHATTVSLWNCETNVKVFNAECAGVSRKYNLTADSEYLIFTFLQGKQLHHYRCPLSTGPYQSVLFDQFPMDGRELRCLLRFSSPPSPHDNGRQRQYLLTAGEYCRVHLLESINSTIRQRLVLTEPNSVITGLQMVDSTAASDNQSGDSIKLLFSCGGKEGLFCWRLIIDAIDGSVRGAPLLASAPPVTTATDPRVMDIAVCYWTNTAAEKVLLIGTVNSDGTFRLWRFDERDSKFIYLAELEYTKRCPQRIQLGGGDAGRLLFYLSATDGHISVIQAIVSGGQDAAILSILAHPIKVHQSGIGAMCLRHAIDSNGDSTEWICTGGDDQDLVITGVQAKQNELILLAQKRLSNTHSAAIQALCIIPIDGDNNSDDGFILAAASIDQRLNFWLVNGGKEIDKACLLHSMMFSVADVCAMDIITCNDGSLLITLVGVGMQQIRLSLSAEEVKKGNPRWKPTDTSERRIDI